MATHVLSDILVVVHLLWATFMVGGCLLAVASVWFPAWRQFMAIRTIHVIGIIFTASVPLWAGICPVTSWENALRLKAGTEAIPHSFLSYYAERILYPDVPPWTITLATTLVAVVSVALYIIIPPWRRRPHE